MDNDFCSEVDLQRAMVIALAHRLAALKAIRTTTLPAVLLFGVLSWHLGTWMPFLACPFGIWAVSIAISIWSANNVTRRTGLSHASQQFLWERYKSDPEFSAEINLALQDRNLLG
ncbi:hypothetical protein [Dyella silvae]|uniref:hypothetical protein n=1 Tax=Dyella silvae TaxID=2994424 RepID=UPI002264B01B|nr:hypothetical protein [Dyella silvae]